MVGIHSDLRGQVESDGKPRLALIEQIAIALVGFSSTAKSCVLAHGPEAAAIHRRINAARVGKFARVAQGCIGVPVWKRFPRIEAFDGKAGKRGEPRFAVGGDAGFDLAIGHSNTRSGATRGMASLVDGL